MNSDKKQHIHTQLRTIRERKGLSQQFVGDLANLSQSQLSKFENTGHITLIQLLLLCDVLEVDLIDLLETSTKNFSLHQTNNDKSIGVSIKGSRNEKAYEDHISSLRKENDFLKTTINKLLNKHGNK